jgi:PIN domain nuclease of toxin-antitoxin system
MNLLLDTHLLIWVAENSSRLSPKARNLVGDFENQLFFSIVSIWEIAIKSNLGRADFEANPKVLRSLLLDNGYLELPIAIHHIVTLDSLPLRHKDPFDRMIIAQAKTESLILLTSDAVMAEYGGDIIKV